MKTIFCEHDLAFKSPNKDELIEMGLEYLSPAKPGVRNELTKMVQRSKREGFQLGKKSNFVAGFDKKRDEYFLYIKNHYEPVYQLAMLFELISEDFGNSETDREMEIRKQQINSYLSVIEKNEELDLREESAKLINLSGSFIQTYAEYRDDDNLTEEELHRLSERIDFSFFKPMSEIIEEIMNQFISGNLPISFGLEEDSQN